MEKRPLPADEKTRVIPQNIINQQKPAQPSVQQPAAPKPPFGAFQQNKEKGAVEKKRIVPGLLIGGGLLAGGLLLTSFSSSPDAAEEVPVDTAGSTNGGGSIPAVVSTSLPVSDVVANDLPFDEARELARAEIGSEGLFKHQGVIHTTKTEEEMELLTPEQREQFMSDIIVNPNTTSGTEVDVDGEIMEIKFPLMEKHTEILVDEDGHAYSRDRDGNVNLLDNVSEDPITGDLVRMDPETGELTQFNPTAILTNVDEGKIDISIYPSDVEVTNDGEVLWQAEPVEPISETSYVTNYNDDGTWTAGYDYDGDGVVDLAIENSWDEQYQPEELVVEDAAIAADVTPKSESELLNERIKQIAEDAGIDDVRKIKVNETDDGYNIKIKGEDGEKIKMHLSSDDLKPKAETGIDNATGDDATTADDISTADELTAYQEDSSMQMPDFGSNDDLSNLNHHHN